MLSAGIIIADKTHRDIIHSFQEIEGKEWNCCYSGANKNIRSLEHGLIFSSADILPLVSDLLIVLDPEYCKFDYLSNAIRNGCHLFLSENINLNFEERRELIRLAKEGATVIQIKNDFLFQPGHQNMISGKNLTCFIDICHSQPLMEENLEERLRNNLSLVQMIAGVPVHHFDVFGGEIPKSSSDIINIYIKFNNGTTASINFTFKEESHTHVMKIYDERGLNIIDLFRNVNDPKKDNLQEDSVMTGQLNSFITSIREKSSPQFSLTDEIEIYLLLKKIKEKFNMYSVLS